MSSIKVNWFPGHMKKGIEDLEQSLKILDFVIEVIDARAPITTHNESLVKLIKNTPLITVANKKDLALNVNAQDKGYLAISTTNKNFKNLIIERIKEKLALKIERLNKKGATGYKLKGIVIGLPNVGKSSVINLLASKKLASVENRPGVTKRNQWLKISNDIEIWDAPGILPRKVENLETLYKLVAINCIEKDDSLKNKTAEWIFNWFIEKNNQTIFIHYKISLTRNYQEFLEFMARNNGFLMKEAKPDLQKAEDKLIKDFSNGLLGTVYLD